MQEFLKSTGIIIGIILGGLILFGLFIMMIIGPSESTSDPNTIDPADCVVLIYTSGGLGSGVVVSPDGIILTAGHMVKDYYLNGVIPPTSVVFSNGTKYDEFEYIYVDEHVDIAYFKIKNVKNLPYLELGDFFELDVGDEIWAIGMPFGEKWWYSYGYVSKDSDGGTIYMDISLNPGNSGCPILNDKNEIVGICTEGIFSGNDMVFGHTSNICAAILDQYKWLFNLYD